MAVAEVAVPGALAGVPVPGGGERGVQAGLGGCQLVHRALAAQSAGLCLQEDWCVFLAKKHTGQDQLNVVAPGRLLHLFDVSQRHFWADTVAAYSVFPYKSLNISSGPQLTGAGSQVIECWGEQEMSLCFHCPQFNWTFLLANVQQHIRCRFF